VVRAGTLHDPDAGPLFTALLRSTSDRMALRLPGTENDIRVTRTTAYPLEQIGVPILVVHGTAERLVPFAQHGQVLATRIPGAELLAIEGSRARGDLHVPRPGAGAGHAVPPPARPDPAGFVRRLTETWLWAIRPIFRPKSKATVSACGAGRSPTSKAR
jgi:pimeloyl-ACP methyl ester carboxylesterase